MHKILSASFLILMLNAFVAMPCAAQEEETMVGYVSLDPEIVTNFITNSSKLGFIRINIELMAGDVSTLPDIEIHLPLLRATVIDVLGQQPETRVKSLIGREDIRKDLKQKLNDTLMAETGLENPIKDLFFTKYLYQ